MRRILLSLLLVAALGDAIPARVFQPHGRRAVAVCCCCRGAVRGGGSCTCRTRRMPGHSEECEIAGAGCGGARKPMVLERAVTEYLVPVAPEPARSERTISIVAPRGTRPAPGPASTPDPPPRPTLA